MLTISFWLEIILLLLLLLSLLLPLLLSWKIWAPCDTFLAFRLITVVTTCLCINESISLIYFPSSTWQAAKLPLLHFPSLTNYKLHLWTYCLIQHHIVVLWVPFNMPLSPSQILLMLLIRSVNTCTSPLPLISLLQSVFWDTFRVLCIWAFASNLVLPPSLPSLTLIGQVTHMIDAQPLALLSSLATTPSHGCLRNNILFPGHPLRLSIGHLPQELPSLPGCVKSYMILAFSCPLPLLSSVTTLVPLL